MLKDVSSFSVAAQFSDERITGSINSVDVETIDNQFALAVTENGVYFIYDTLNMVPTFCTSLKKKTVLTDCCWMKHDNGIFCVSSFDHKVRVYVSNDPERMFSEPYDCGMCVHRCQFSPNQPIMACALDKGSVRLLDIRQKVNLHAFSTKADEDIIAIDWAPDSGNIIACGDLGGRLFMFDIRQERKPYAFGWWKGSFDDTENEGNAHDCDIVGLCFSKTGRTISSLDDQGHIKQWDVDKGISTFHEYKIGIHEKTYTRFLGMCDSQYGILVPEKNVITNLNTKEQMVGHIGDVCSIAPTFDGFVSVGTDSFFCVWKDGEIVLNDQSDWSD